MLYFRGSLYKTPLRNIVSKISSRFRAQSTINPKGLERGLFMGMTNSHPWLNGLIPCCRAPALLDRLPLYSPPKWMWFKSLWMPHDSLFCIPVESFGILLGFSGSCRSHWEDGRTWQSRSMRHVGWDAIGTIDNAFPNTKTKKENILIF